MLLEDICDSESDTDSDEEAQEVDEQDMFKKMEQILKHLKAFFMV